MAFADLPTEQKHLIDAEIIRQLEDGELELTAHYPDGTHRDVTTRVRHTALALLRDQRDGTHHAGPIEGKLGEGVATYLQSLREGMIGDMPRLEREHQARLERGTGVEGTWNYVTAQVGWLVGVSTTPDEAQLERYRREEGRRQEAGSVVMNEMVNVPHDGNNPNAGLPVQASTAGKGAGSPS